MALIALTKGYRISSEDIVAIITVSDLTSRASEEERTVIQEDIRKVIENAKSRGVYYQFSRGQDVIRSVLILRNGMVFGTSVTGDTIITNMGIDTRIRQPRKKRS